MLLTRNDRAARNVRLCFIDEGLCPREIVIFDLAFGKALVQQGPRRLLDGGEVAGRDQGAKAGFLIGSESDCHDSFYRMASAGIAENAPNFRTSFLHTKSPFSSRT